MSKVIEIPVGYSLLLSLDKIEKVGKNFFELSLLFRSKYRRITVLLLILKGIGIEKRENEKSRLSISYLLKSYIGKIKFSIWTEDMIKEYRKRKIMIV
jgi:hypothetical protein